MRDRFVLRTNALISNIPSYCDYRIKWSMSELASILRDGHTRIVIPRGYIFPFEFVSLRDGFYFTGVPKEHERLLYGRLAAINGICVEDIVSRFAEVIHNENIYGLRSDMVWSFLRRSDLLDFINVTDGSGSAEFTFVDINGETACATVAASDFSPADIDLRHNFDTLMNSRPDRHFWFTHFPENSMIYVRINSFFYVFGLRQREFVSGISEIFDNLLPGEQIERFVVDLRRNPGGDLGSIRPFLDILEKRQQINRLYILVDGGSLSSSVILTALAKNYLDNVFVVGEPTGQPENFFSGGHGVFLSNSGILAGASDSFNRMSDSEDAAIRPDILIPLTIDDIINNRDPVLEYIKSRYN